MALLTISGLRAGYGNTPVLHGVTLSVEEGEIAALLGSNGAGKTTTLRAVSGLVPVSAGVIRLGEEVLNGRGAEGIVSLGIAHSPEGRGVFPALTVEENLKLGGYVRRRSGDTFGTVMEQVYDYFPRLLERRTQAAGTLSGGEQQMLAIARAMMSSPRLLLVDEASLGLAPIVVQRLFEIVQEINAAGTTVLMVEQNANFALRIAHRAFVMQKGTIVFGGTGAELQGAGVAEAYLGAIGRNKDSASSNGNGARTRRRARAEDRP